jgi:hypothetical protein
MIALADVVADVAAVLWRRQAASGKRQLKMARDKCSDFKL